MQWTHNVPTPVRDKDKPFLMPVEDVFTITGRGTVVTGRAERGTLAINDEVEIVGIRPTQKTTVTGIEMFRKQLDEVGLARTWICFFVAPSVKTWSVARLLLHLVPLPLTRSSKGLLTSLQRTRVDVTTLLHELPSTVLLPHHGRDRCYLLPEGTEMVMPGDTTDMKVDLIQPIAMEEGLSFAIREGGRTVGAGTVTKIIK